MAVHQSVLEEVAVPDGGRMHGLSQVKWADTGQLAILAAHCWKMANLSLASSTLSVCLSQAVNPLSEEMHKN